MLVNHEAELFQAPPNRVTSADECPDTAASKVGCALPEQLLSGLALCKRRRARAGNCASRVDLHLETTALNLDIVP